MNQKKMKKSRQRKAATALFLALVLSLPPCSLFWGGNVSAEAATFKITKLKQDSIIRDGYFYFYGSLMLPEVFYWVKSDGGPLFCIQKKSNIVADLYGSEVIEEYDSSQYLSEEKYELVSLVLQCCGLIQGENTMLEPGTYLAGQAAVWGITSANWRGGEHFRQEMEVVHEHIEDWYETPAEEILAKSQEAVDRICEAIDAYYGDESPYVPSFASKYEKKAPVWTAQKQADGSCEVVFALDDKSEAIKEFEFQMPQGWSCEWQEDKVVFRCGQAEEGLISIEGRAKEGSVLDEAMPIGLIHIVGPANFPHFQRLASDVECRTNWNCYFKLLITEPEDAGNCYLPKVHYYRHQETFTALYGVGIEKLDGNSREPIGGVKFQLLEYFDARQLKNTCLDAGQIECWKGWKARCGPEITDQDGHLEHWDKREYRYEKTYCSGHPEPVIIYKGSDESRRKQLEEEAEAAWKAEVVECSRICDFHCIDGSGEELLKEDRDLTYQQFIHLIYGYSFKETKAAPGYLPYKKTKGNTEAEKVFLVSLQAGGEWQEELREENQEKLQGEMQEEQREEGKQEEIEEEERASRSNAEYRKEEDKKDDVAAKEESEIATEEEKAEEKELEDRNIEMGMKKTQQQRRKGADWTTSLIPPLVPVMPDTMISYFFTVKNYKKKTPPEETTPEETLPEETTPEETPPEETPPEETLPEETSPEETPPKETTPEETLPQNPPPTVSHSSGNPGGGRRKVEISPPEMPQEASEFFSVEEAPVPQAISRIGWIEANYATPSVVQKGKNNKNNVQSSLPKTGDGGISTVVLLLFSVGSGSILFLLRKRRCKAAAFFLGLFFCALWTCESRAEEREKIALLLEQQIESEDNKLVLYYSKEEVSGETGEMAYVWEEDKNFEGDEETEEGSIPAEGLKEMIVDERGQKYWLESCRLVSRILPEKEEWVSEKVSYSAVEAEGQIPENLWFQAKEEDTGRVGEGELRRFSVDVSAPYWKDQFQIPLRFCDYDAESYQLQEMEVPKEQALEYLMEHQRELLESAGCSPEAYQIDGIVWNGEAYPAQGIIYREAVAYGKKRVSDCLAEYRGMLTYPEWEQEQWEAVYALPLSAALSQDLTEAEAVETAADETEETKALTAETVNPPEEKGFSWIQLRRIAAYTVSVAVLLPVFVYFFLLKHRKKGSSAE